MDEPVIDVLIAVYNGASTVRSSLASIQSQSVENIRIIVVDDGSTDGTLAILEELAQADARIMIVSRPHSGIVASLNAGLAYCSAPFIARFDADDLAYPHRFATQLAYLNAHPNCLAVASSAIHIDENDRPLGTRIRQRPLEQADAAWIPCREPYLLQPFLMIRKISIDAVHGYRLCEVAEDSDLYWRLQEIGELRNTDDILGAYRLNPDSISSKSIVNGRRMALCSQLVGISALRRRMGEPDLVFDLDRIQSYAQAVTLEEFCRLGSKGLTDGERLRLRIAASAKLLELASYRPYELDRGDCRFIRHALIEGDGLLHDENRQSLKALVTDAGMRLLASGKLIEACLLAGPALPYIMFRLAFRTLLPPSLRKFLKGLAGRQTDRCSLSGNG